MYYAWYFYFSASLPFIAKSEYLQKLMQENIQKKMLRKGPSLWNETSIITCTRQYKYVCIYTVLLFCTRIAVTTLRCFNIIFTCESIPISTQSTK